MSLKKMVFAVLPLFFCFCLLCSPYNQAWAGFAREPAISAHSALLMDVTNGQVLYCRNHLQPRPMASTTKVMTAIVALGGADLHGTVTVSSRAASVGESSMHIKAGEKLTLEQLLYGALIRSGNDACVAIAEHVAGSEKAFVLLMNVKAVLLGARNTKFQNTNGLPATDHYSTAIDLALIARYALHDPTFNRIVKTRSKIIEGSDGMVHYLQNTNQLLWRYPGADGVKTGTTVAAGKCLIASASKADRRLLAVILNGHDRFKDAGRLLDYGFEQFKPVTLTYAGEIYSSVRVVDGERDAVPVKIDDTVMLNMRADGTDRIEKKVQMQRTLKAPVLEGQPVGKMYILINGNEAGSADIVAACGVNKLSGIHKLNHELRKVRDKFTAGCKDFNQKSRI
jgi:D-alanyl-D-alanine carboxypeptidase (penicillin-binding protein 5/6)